MSLTLTEEEAALYISLRVAYGDRQLSDTESRTIAQYYDLARADALYEKISAENLQFQEADSAALDTLRQGSRESALKALAVGARVAGADQKIDHEETDLLVRYATALSLDLGTVLNFLKDD